MRNSHYLLNEVKRRTSQFMHNMDYVFIKSQKKGYEEYGSLRARVNFEGKVYKMSAALEDGTVKAKIDWHDRSGNGDKAEFEADVSFMSKLQEIVSKYDLAKHNGYTYHVSGLPDMYGDHIDIKYASGESIYASDNQSGFLKAEAAMELINLFLSFNI